MQHTKNTQTETFSGARSMRIVQDNARDNSSLTVKNPKGGKMGGSDTNLSHSLSGSSAVQQDKSKDHPL